MMPNNYKSTSFKNVTIFMNLNTNNIHKNQQLKINKHIPRKNPQHVPKRHPTVTQQNDLF